VTQQIDNEICFFNNRFYRFVVAALVRSHTGNATNRVSIRSQGEGDWTLGNETQVDTMRAGLAMTQKDTIRTRADNHRETDDTRTSKQDTISGS